ncbi:aminotransferase class V-fold PLP-dependent enzyme, partial [Candidatus Pacearchaeota archaeon]|nr:aminotransferase class V-fold PLP-dependent enzyme [Candidatus Pacearchaeota archaeon]
MLAPMGIGVLYAKKELLSDVKPLLYGGDMIKEVGLIESSFAELPRRFEAGTQNVEAVIGLSAAIDYLNKIGMDNIQKHERELIKYAMSKMRNIRGIRIYGPKERSGIISFNLGDLHSHDVAEFLGSRGISVRAGHMCCQPLMKKLGISSCVRASFYIYNTKEDIDALCNVLEECRRFFKC